MGNENNMVNTAIILPHPDDELFALGYCLQIKARHPIHMLTVTLGEAGRSMIPFDKKTIQNRRSEEYRHVCEFIKAESISQLDWGDGKGAQWRRERCSEDLKTYIKANQIKRVVTFDGSGGNGHPDHKRLSSLIDGVSQGLEVLHITLYPESLIKKLFWFLPKGFKNKLIRKGSQGDSHVDFVLRLNHKELKTKIALIKSYKSQFPDQKGRYYKMPYFLMIFMMRYEAYHIPNREQVKLLKGEIHDYLF